MVSLRDTLHWELGNVGAFFGRRDGLHKYLSQGIFALGVGSDV